jgi:hypothetical protein
MATEVDFEWANEEAADEDALAKKLCAVKGRDVLQRAINRINALEQENAVERSNVRRWQDAAQANLEEAATQGNRRIVAEQENAQLRAENTKLKQPVSEREWADAQTLNRSIYLTDAERASQIIAARSQTESGK